ncbi:MAG: tetratricopeptide repeat protein [Dysgonamonadaceae bacterium]|nr:tetratricopeptide repeat protein [Dysgonamonadaceae bacterium]
MEESEKFDYFFLEALRLKFKGENTNTYNTLLYALQLNPTSSAALYEISELYFRMKEYDSGLTALKKAVEYSPDNFDYKLSLANMQRQMKNFPEAIEIYEELSKENPQDIELYFHLSNLYLQPTIFDLDKAVEALNGLENNMGINEAVSMQKYQLYMSLERKEDAVRELQKLIDKFPNEAKYQMALGDFYLSENESDKALDIYNKVSEKEPNNPYYFISMSNYYEKTGDKEKSRIEIEKALLDSNLEINTKLEILDGYLQNLLKSKKNIESGNDLFRSLMEQHSQVKELNILYGQFLMAQNKPEEAKFQFQIVTEALPEDLTSWISLLDIVIREGNPKEIIATADKALAYFPEISEFYFYKATALSLEKEYQKALKTYSAGLEFVSKDDSALISLFHGQIGDVYYRLGDREKAFANYDKAIEYNRSNVNVLNNYAYHLSMDKEELDKAERMAATANQLHPDNPTYLDTYAWIFFQKGIYSLAKFYIERAISLDENPGKVVLEHYGDILYKSGDSGNAVTQWEKALSMPDENDSEEKTNNKVLKKKIKDRVYYEK